jgi:hypothetical protein
MAETQHNFPQFAIGVGNGNINLSSGTWKVALGNAAGPVTLATSGISTAKLFTDWTAIVAEITGAGYIAGGVTVSAPTWLAGGTNNATATFTSATNPSWTGATFSANQAVLYQSSASGYQLACFWDFGGSIPVSSQTFLLTINAAGFFNGVAS